MSMKMKNKKTGFDLKRYSRKIKLIVIVLALILLPISALIYFLLDKITGIFAFTGSVVMITTTFISHLIIAELKKNNY